MAVNPIPEGFTAVTPYLLVANPAGAIEFLKKAFNAVEHMRMPGPNGTIMHASLSINGARIMLGSPPPSHPPLPAMCFLYLADCDEAFDRAVAAGAKANQPMEDQPWGDRAGAVTDLNGTVWWIATCIEHPDARRDRPSHRRADEARP